jgi:hypothetical protein
VLWIYVGFVAVVLVMLAVDLGVFHRHAHEVPMGEALGWTVVWRAGGSSPWPDRHRAQAGSSPPVRR